MKWRLNRILWPVYNLGPGKRIGVWVQGCSLRCPGCLSPGLHSADGGRAVDVSVLAGKVAGAARRYDGITITGGEPFDQYLPLMDFLSRIRETTRLSVFVYTGYTLGELEKMLPDGRFLHLIDYLVDGRYENGNPARDTLRGSDNQVYYHCTAGTPAEVPPGQEPAPWTFARDASGSVCLSGVPAAGDMARIRERLLEHGIAVEFQ